MTTDETPDPPKRQRPTVALVHELTLERDTERRRRAQIEEQLARTQTTLAEARAAREAEQLRWDEFDAEAKALGALVAPLSEYVGSVRNGRWGLSQAEQAEVDGEVAEAVERILVAVGARFGAQLVAARIVEVTR